MPDRNPVYVRATTEEESPYFANRSSAEVVIATLIQAQTDGWAKLHGFVVLPEALEMVVTPLKHGIASLVAHIQAETIPLLAIMLPNAVQIWERRFMQVSLTSQRSLDARLEILLLSPVANGLVNLARAYPYSSANPRYATSVAVFAGFANETDTTEASKIGPVAVSARPPVFKQSG
ncbi:MAG: hypothetical protein KC496_14365 [Anaerolineae bacterium]|nr:hypothetical protein [Anaerolineae bacterium]